MFHALAMIVLGLFLGLVGTDVTSGTQRYAFGMPELADGLNFVIVAMGIFGIGEMIANLEDEASRKVGIAKVDGLMPTREDWSRMIAPMLRGTALGAALGILPGAGAALASFCAYALEKNVASYADQLGKGAIEGVAAPEAANNAGAQMSFVPMLTLGMPSNPVMALMIGAMIVKGIQPGPSVMTEQPALFWGLIASMWVGNVMLLVLNLPLVGLWVRMVAVPYHYLYPMILVFCAIGVFSLSNNAFDLYVMAVRLPRLPVQEARLRAGADAARLHPGAGHGGVPATHAAALAGRPDGSHRTAQSARRCCSPRRAAAADAAPVVHADAAEAFKEAESGQSARHGRRNQKSDIHEEEESK